MKTLRGSGGGTRCWEQVLVLFAYLLRGLRREYVDIKHLPVRVKEPAQLLVAAARRHAAHKELVLRVRLTAVGRVDGRLGEADL